MIALVDAVVILVLLALAVSGLPAHAAPVGVWLAFTTPLLVRSDLERQRLPNAATVPAAVLALACSGAAVALPTGAAHPEAGVAVWALVGTLGIIARQAGLVGLGDVKLACAVVPGSQLAWSSGAAVMLAGCAGAGLVTIAATRRSRRLRVPGRPAEAPVPPPAGGSAMAGGSPRGRPRSAQGGIPFGPSLLAGYWASVAALGLMRAAESLAAP